MALKETIPSHILRTVESLSSVFLHGDIQVDRTAGDRVTGEGARCQAHRLPPFIYLLPRELRKDEVPDSRLMTTYICKLFLGQCKGKDTDV